MADLQCSINGCEKPRYQNKSMCGSHYMRSYRYGDPHYRHRRITPDLSGQRFGALVAIERARPNAWHCRCDCGVTKIVLTGDLNSGGTSSCGASVHLRKAETYNAVHIRLRRDFGSANDYRCTDCGGPAAHWSYDHAAADEQTDAETGLPFSTDLEHYHPRCVSCHKLFDLAAA